MGLRFVFGPSGVGKSTSVYEEIIERSLRESDRNYLVLVPDQFTMETQKDMVRLHPRGGIMNIDVLSFGRLGHRILEETGGGMLPVLDDTGKSLILQRVAGQMKEDLPALGSHLHKQGYIHEVKSAISEFMQYGISPDRVSDLIAFAGKRGALSLKLADLKALYEGFEAYIRDKFITTEETLEVVCRHLKDSAVIRDSVIVVDGFTGFTPIQNRLLQDLMRYSSEMIVVLTLGEGENPYEVRGEQRLFHLTQKTVEDLERLGGELGVRKEEDRRLDRKITYKEREEKGIAGNPAMHCLEQNLFRYTVKPFEEKTDRIHIRECTTPAGEARQAGLAILDLVRNRGIAYRDVAVVCGNLEEYAPYLEAEFGKMEIPAYIDRTRGIVLNPLTEYIKSGLGLFLKDFSYEAVFHFLRSGLAEMEAEEADRLENYILETGIRGYRAWSRLFTRRPSCEDPEGELGLINSLRQRLLDSVALLQFDKKAPVKVFIQGLYDFLVAGKVAEHLHEYELMFEAANEAAKAREYAQIYRLVMDLLAQIYDLLGEEVLSLKEFADILEAGFGEIQVGTIPQNVDRVLVGDMERTRLKPVRFLFFLGVNDGNIPKTSGKGGIISHMDREFLQESGLALAPTPRQQMYIQRLYLYLNVTKPSEGLYVSFCKLNSSGKSLRPSFFIETLKKLFPMVEVEYPEQEALLKQVVTPAEGLSLLAEGLRGYVEGNREREGEVLALYAAYEGRPEEETSKKLADAAFKRYEESGLSAAVARALYGLHLENSVSRLETYAACAYRHFLRYGLSLRERQEFGLEEADMGNIFHGVLERFSGELEGSDYTWFDFPREYGEQKVSEAMEALAAEYGNTILYANARNEYSIGRMKRLMTRTVATLQNQLQKGAFRPEGYELSFRYASELESIHLTLSEEERMHLLGRIDRVDVADHGDQMFVKVIDYKSGNRQFDLAAVYHGLQLQLVVYLKAAMEMVGKKYPGKETVPAALLYYHIQDPAVDTPTELSPEEIEKEILGKLRMNGVVNSDERILSDLDRFMETKSDVVPVERKKDGSLSARSKVMSTEELGLVSAYVGDKIRRMGREILAGHKEINPYGDSGQDACTYCDYKKVCGFDPSIPGYQKRQLANPGTEEILEAMRRELEEGRETKKEDR